ncbi:hypothetical protein HDV06_001977 [Boothiomyces sp. JEL0866]|nr:hypothetical protein HDV06_001977 [Boothiomyces sp. JEL0866]
MNEELDILNQLQNAKKSNSARQATELQIANARKNAILVMDELCVYLNSMRNLAIAKRVSELEILSSILDQSNYGQIPKEILDMHQVEYDIEVTVKGMEAQLRALTLKRDEQGKGKTSVQTVSKIETQIFDLKREIINCYLDFKLITLELNKVEVDWTIQCIEHCTKKPITSFGYFREPKDGNILAFGGVPNSTDQSEHVVELPATPTQNPPASLPSSSPPEIELFEKPAKSPLEPNNVELEKVEFVMPKLLNKSTVSSNSLKTERLIPAQTMAIITEKTQSDSNHDAKDKLSVTTLPPFRENSFVKDTNTLTKAVNDDSNNKSEASSPANKKEIKAIPPATVDKDIETDPQLKLKKEIIKKYPNGVPREVYVKAMKERNRLVDMLTNNAVDRNRFVERWELVHANGEIGNFKKLVSKLSDTIRELNTKLSSMVTVEKENNYLKKQLENANIQIQRNENLENENGQLLSEIKELKTVKEKAVLVQEESKEAMLRMKSELAIAQNQLKNTQSLHFKEREMHSAEKEKLIIESETQRLEIERLAKSERVGQELEFENRALRSELERLAKEDLERENQALRVEIERLNQRERMKLSVEEKLDFRIENPKEYPGGIPRKDYERAIEERNRFAEMCKLLSVEMLENGVEEMYITVAKKVGGIKQRLAYSDKQNGRLRNEILQLKQEIERLRTSPVSPLPSEYESEISEEFVWLSQLESIIASENYSK